jgi:type II secretory pathway pseudopilin PulG
MAEQKMALTILVAVVCGFIGGLVGGFVAPMFMAAAVVGAQANAAAVELEEANERGRAKQTMADLRTLGTATEAFAVDNARYPTVSSMADAAPLLQPTYVKAAPTQDGWNQVFSYTSEEQSYIITSVGPDGTRGTDDDIVYSNGEFLQFPGSLH